jgi:hypothetical protein
MSLPDLLFRAVAPGKCENKLRVRLAVQLYQLRCTLKQRSGYVDRALALEVPLCRLCKNDLAA